MPPRYPPLDPPVPDAAGRYPAPAPQGGDGADLRELFAIISRRSRSIALAALLATACGVGYVLLTPKAYTSTVSILIDARAKTPLGAEPTIANTSTPDAALIESQVRLIASDAILRRVVEQEKLGDNPAYGQSAPGLLARLTGAASINLDTPEDRAARALAGLRRNVTVKRSERTYVMDVDVTAADGATAARLGNAVASAYIADQADAKAQGARRDGEALNARLNDLQQRLSLAESRVQAYKAAHQIFDANGKRINEQDLTEGATALSTAHAHTADAKSRLDQIQRIIASGRSADAVTEALKSPAIDRLRAQYTDIARQEANYRTTLGDRHPALIETMNQAREVRGLINEELKRIAAGAANDYQAARDNEAASERQVNVLKKSANITSQASVELRGLEHDVDASKAVYDKFLRARESVGETGLDGPLARVIAPALIPTTPSAPKTLPILGLALASGLFVGIGYAFLREYLDQGRPQVSGLRQPVAAKPARRKWPLWPRKKAAPDVIRAARGKADAAPEAASQAVGALWAELLADAPIARHRAPFIIMVTSTEAQSGKTGTAIDLAFAAAASGERVLLLDADTDDPALADSLNLDNEPYLLDFMGTLRPCYRLETDSQADISVLPILPDEAAIVRRLTRQTPRHNIDGVNGNFTTVILDAGRVDETGEGSDLAAAADRIVLVTQQARLSRFQISRTLTTLGVDDDKFGGVMCNTRPARNAA